MDMAKGELRFSSHGQHKLNWSDSSLGSSTAMTDAIKTTNGYQKTGDLITLFTFEEIEIEQNMLTTVKTIYMILYHM